MSMQTAKTKNHFKWVVFVLADFICLFSKL